MNGVKIIEILARAIYPVVTAYEFEFLKTESVVKDWLHPCTIYFIVQRPLTYMSNVFDSNGILEFEIMDARASEPLKVRFDPRECGYADPKEEILIEYQFYKDEPDTEYPIDDVAAIKILKENGEFVVWLTAQKIIYLYLKGKLAAEIEGNLEEYIDYKVHYIGQAFSQEVWERLTGHEKMQSILTVENTLGKKIRKNSYEISLIMLSVTGYDELNIIPANSNLNWPGKKMKPILHKIMTEEEFKRFNTPSLATDAEELTNEIEAMLINLFQPTYNEIKFKNYPVIKKGTRSAGYTAAQLKIETLPAILYTDTHRQGLILPMRA